MPAPETRCFIDSNVWLYAFIEGGHAEKSDRARSIVQANSAVISTQVINEVCVNLVKQADFAESDVRRLVRSFYRRCAVVSLDQAISLKRG